MNDSPVSYALEEKIAVVVMDDGKANALSGKMLDGLESALERAEREAAALVLAGRPGRFCAGFDLRIMMSDPDAATALVRRGGELLMRLYGSPLPIVVACGGHAVAAGALVLLCADMRIGAEGAFRIGLNELTIGLPVPVLAMELARTRLAVGELSRATLMAEIYAPEAAVRAGYLDGLAPSEDLLGRARAEASKLGALSRFAYHSTKMRLRGATIRHIRETMDQDIAALLAGRGA